MDNGIHPRAVPSVQLMELMFPLRERISTPEALGRLARSGFYAAAETAVLCDPAESRETRRICRDAGMRWTCWASPFIIAEGLNLSSVDPALWHASVLRMKRLLLIAADGGADGFAFLSGPCPALPERIPEAVKRTAEAMALLAEAAAAYENLDLLIEPLDRHVHKRNTIGPTADAAAVIRHARGVNPRVYMGWDSAHAALQGEDLIESLGTAGDTVRQLHLCNAVLDPADKLYGDYHLPPGGRGYLTLPCAAAAIQAALALPLRCGGLPVAVEARPDGDPFAAEEGLRAFLAEALRLAERAAGGARPDGTEGEA